MAKTPLDLRREVPMVLSDWAGLEACGFEVVDSLWYGPPGHARYYSVDDATGGLMFACPGDGELSSIAFKKFDGHPVWTWNGDRERPTCTPSILCDPAKGGCGWHGFLVRGRFQLSPA